MTNIIPADPADPHAGGHLAAVGPSPEAAAITLIFIHGRGAKAEDILSLYKELSIADAAALAPQAFGSTWYPQSFLAPLEANQPFLDSALRRIEALIGDLIQRRIRADRVALVGFSQGACLALQFALQYPRRYAAIAGLTGGLIGPPGTVWKPAGSLSGTPIFMGSGDPDPHVPFHRVLESKAVLEKAGAEVELRRYPGMGHSINRDELTAVRALLMRSRNGKVNK